MQLVQGQSIGKLFIGALIPGVLIGLFQIVMNLIISYRNKYPIEKMNCKNVKELLTLLQESIFALLMPLIVIGSVVLAIATSNEAASFGVMYAIIIGYFMYKSIKIKAIPVLFSQAIKVSSSIMIIIASSQLYVWILSIEMIPAKLGAYIVSLGLVVL